MNINFESPGPGKLIENVFQGQCKISGDPETILSTVLGSCISACIFDPESKVGGMNHFLLPESTDPSADPMRYGAHSMEVLLNSLFKAGAQRRNLLVKIAGGAQVTQQATDIGSRNAEFVLAFLRQEGFRIVSRSLGGATARRVLFHPSSGEARVRIVGMTAVRETPVVVPAPRPDIALF